MQIHTLPSSVKTKSRRLGQGHGTGRSKTSGRGTKGQKARTKIPLFFEGGALRLIKRLPFRRGKGRNKVFKKQPVVVNLAALNLLPNGSIVDLSALIKRKIVTESDAKTYGVKILGNGDLAVSLTIALPISKSAAKKIEKAGGSIAGKEVKTKVSKKKS